MNDKKETLSQAILDFRPEIVDELCGISAKRTAETILAQAESGWLRPVLLYGPTGVGKTTIARIVAAYFGYEVIEYNCSSETGVSNARDIIEAFTATRLYGPVVFILDEIQGLSKNAQNALLTPVEGFEPPNILFAATTEPKSLIKPLKTRFQQFELKSPTELEQKKFVLQLCQMYAIGVDKEGLVKVDSPEAVVAVDELASMVSTTEGSVRTLVKGLANLTLGYSYKDATIEEEQPEPIRELVKLVFSKTYDHRAIATKVYELDTNSLEGLRLALCNYAIGCLRGSGASKTPLSVLSALGEFDPTALPERSRKIAFIKRLMEVA